jgi:hypothetical protein
MTKTMIGLGVLSIPAAFDVLGIIPGVLCLLAVATITIWSMFVVGTFKLNHPEVYAIDDVGYKLFGITGRVLFGTTFWICKNPDILLLYGLSRSSLKLDQTGFSFVALGCSACR